MIHLRLLVRKLGFSIVETPRSTRTVAVAGINETNGNETNKKASMRRVSTERCAAVIGVRKTIAQKRIYIGCVQQRKQLSKRFMLIELYF